MTDAGSRDAASRYLLGEMTEEERDAFELRLLEDAALSEEVAAAEADFLDDYLRDELSAGERPRVERHLLATPAQRQRLAAAQALRTALERRAGFGRSLWWSAAAAALVAVVGLAVVRLPRQPDRPEPARPVASNPVTRPQPEPRPEPAAVVPSEPRQPVMVTLVLASMTTRSDGRAQSLLVPQDAATVRLVVGLQDGDDEFPSYRAVVQTIGGTIVERRERLALAKGAVQIDVPASRLRDGDYEVLVDGAPLSGEPEPLGAWSFRIIR